MKNRIAGVIMLLATGISSFGQSSSNTWETETIKDLRNNEEFPFTCQFKIYPNDHIEWIQGDAVQSFTLASSDGNLPETGSGKIIYDLVKEGIPGKIIIERIRAEDIILTLDLREGTELGAYYSFKVFNP